MPGVGVESFDYAQDRLYDLGLTVPASTPREAKRFASLMVSAHLSSWDSI